MPVARQGSFHRCSVLKKSSFHCLRRPQSQRLAILHNGKIKLYNTLKHQIAGVQQQQGGYSGSLTFSSQYGTFSIETLPLVSPGWGGAIVESATPSYETPEPSPTPVGTSRQGSVGSLQSHDDILKALERIGDLHHKGIHRLFASSSDRGAERWREDYLIPGTEGLPAASSLPSDGVFGRHNRTS